MNILREITKKKEEELLIDKILKDLSSDELHLLDCMIRQYACRRFFEGTKITIVTTETEKK